MCKKTTDEDEQGWEPRPHTVALINVICVPGPARYKLAAKIE